MSGSTKEVQLRGHSFLSVPAPLYRPRPRPHHLAKESSEARLAESRKWQHGPSNAPRWKVTVQLARLAAHSKLAGHKGVGAAVANQIVAKKWKQVGNLLKATADGVKRIRALVEKDKQTYLAAAQEALRLAAVGVLDVKLTVRSEHELQNLSYLQQGDASMYTPEALAQRLAIRSQPRFREAVRAWWQWLPLCTLPPEERLTDEEKLMPLDMRGMTKPVYCAMAALIQRVLLPRFGLKPNPSYEPEEDWAFDCRGKRFLLFPQLLNALFELADMWCPTLEGADYVAILTELLEQCKSLEGRHGLFSKFLTKYQRRYGAQDEHKLPISGGYVQSFDRATGRAVQGPAGGAAGGAGSAVVAGEVAAAGAAGSPPLSTAAAAAALMPPAPRQPDEADVVLKALSDDDDSEDHRAATNWWAKIMERNRRYMEAKASGMADETAEAAAAAGTRASFTPVVAGAAAAAAALVSESATDSSEPLQFPIALLGSLFDSRASTPPAQRGAAPGRAGRVPPGVAPAPPAPPPPEPQARPPAAMRLGKGLKGQTAPAPPSAALVATLREAVTDALVEVGASADVAEAAAVLTEEGTIAYQQVGPHTLAELIKVLVDYKRMNTRHIRALIGNSFNRGSPSSNGNGSVCGSNPGSTAGSRVVSRKKIPLPTVAETSEPGTTAVAAAAAGTEVAAAFAAPATAPGIITAAAAAPSDGGGGYGVGAGSGGGPGAGVSRLGAPTAIWKGPIAFAAADTSASAAAGPTTASPAPTADVSAGGGSNERSLKGLSGDTTTTADAPAAAVGSGGGGGGGSGGGSGSGSVTGDGAAEGTQAAFGDGGDGDGGERGGKDGDALEDDEAGSGGGGDAQGGPQVFAARPRTPCMDAATLCAIRATLQGAGLVGVELSGLLASHGMGLATDVQPQVLASVAKTLAEAGFSTEAIVAFLFPPEAEEELEAVGLGPNLPLSSLQLEAMRVALRKAGVDDSLVDLVRSWTADVKAIQATSSALEAAGFTPLEVQRFIAPAASTALIDALRRRGLTPAAAASLLRRDGKGLSMDLEPAELAEAADAMAAAGFTAEQVVAAIGSDAASVPPLEPTGLEACREALLTEGFTEEELDVVVLADNGTALQATIGAATMARVAGALARGGLTCDVIRRFLRYDVQLGAQSRPPQRALRAMQSVASIAVRATDDGPEVEPEDPLLPNGEGVAPDAGVGVVAQIGGALVEAMFKPSQIRAFLLPDEEDAGGREGGAEGAQAADDDNAPEPGPLDRDDVAAAAGGGSSGGSGGAQGGAQGGARRQPRRRLWLSPREVVVFRTVLMASGFSSGELMDLVRPDGRGLDPEADPELAARAVAALSGAGFRGHEIQLFLQLRDPAAALTPGEAAAARSALLTAGFSSTRLEQLLRRDGLGLAGAPEPEPYVMSQVAVVLAETGFPTFHICQYLAPVVPPVPVRVLAIGRYFSQSVSGSLMPSSVSQRSTSQGSGVNPWVAAGATADGRLLPEADVSDDEEDRQAEALAAAEAAAEAAERRRRRQAEEAAEAEAVAAEAGTSPCSHCPAAATSAAVEGAPPSPHSGGDAGSGGAGWVALPPSVLQAMRETVERRCKGLTQKQLRQMAPQMSDAAAAAAAAAAGGGGSASWLPLDSDVTSRAVRSLSNEGFSPDQIRRFFMQPVAALAAGGLGEGTLFDHVAPPLLFLIRALLRSSGFTDQHLSNMMSADRRRLDPDWDVESGAMMVAALARAGFEPHTIRLLLTTGPPVGALTPNELGTINEALLDAGFSRRQLRLVLRPDHSGPGRLMDPTTLAQMATALAHAGCTAGQLCQFLGPPPAAFSKPVPLPLLSPLLALISVPSAAASATASVASVFPNASFAPSTASALTLAASTSTLPLTASASATVMSPVLNSGSAAVVSLSPSVGASGGDSDGGMATASAAAAAGGAVLDSRSVLDIRNVAASCGISSRVLADMIRPDGRGLQRHADPRVIDRVGLHMVNQGFTPAQVYRFLLPTGGCEYGQLDPPTAAAVRAVLLAAGFPHADLKTLLTASNTTLAATAASSTLAAVAYSLAASGASADQLRHILRPPPGAVLPAGPPSGPAGAAPPGSSGESVSSLAITVLRGLMASGYEDHQLDLILRKDGTALRADVGPLRLAQMVAALAAADVPSAAIRLFVRPLGGVQPSVALSLKAALAQCPGFDPERVEAAFSPEPYELGPSVEPSTLADIATALSGSGVSGELIRQLISLPPVAAPAPAPAPAPAAAAAPLPSVPSPGEVSLPAQQQGQLAAAVTSTVAAAAAAASAEVAAGPSPLLRNRAAAGPPGGRLYSRLPYTKMLAMREAILTRWAPSVPSLNPAELLDQEPAKVVVALVDAGYPSEDIRAFVGTDPKLLNTPTFLRGSGPQPPGMGPPGPAAGAGAGGGFVAAVMSRTGGGPAAGGAGPGAPMRMSDPGSLMRSGSKLRSHASAALPLADRPSAARLALLGPGAGGCGVRMSMDGTPFGGPPAQALVGDALSASRGPHLSRISEQPLDGGRGSPVLRGWLQGPGPAWPDFEYRLMGEGAAGGYGGDAALPPPPLTAEQLLAWMAGARQLVRPGRTERFPPGLENQLSSYLRRVLARLVGNDVLRAAVSEAIGVANGAAAAPGRISPLPAEEAPKAARPGLQGARSSEAGERAGLPGRRDSKPGKARVMVKLMAALLEGMLRRLTRGGAAAAQTGGGGGGEDCAEDDDDDDVGRAGGVAAARAAAISYVLAALLDRAPSGSGGGGLAPDCAAPTVLRFLLVSAARQGLLPEGPDPGPPGAPRPQPPLTPDVSLAALASRADLRPRAPDPGHLRSLPPGYSRAWGELPYQRSSLLGCRLAGSSSSPPLVYRALPQRANPSPAATKAGSPRETLPPWPLQRAFVHPHPHPHNASSYPSYVAPTDGDRTALTPASYGRLAVEPPVSPSAAGSAPSPPGGYGFRPAAATTTGVFGPAASCPNAGSPQGPRPLALSGDGSGGGGAGGGCLLLPAARLSGGLGGGPRVVSQTPFFSASLPSPLSSALVGSPSPGRPSSSGLVSGSGPGEGEGATTRLPALRRSASTGRFPAEESSLPTPVSPGAAGSYRSLTRLLPGGPAAGGASGALGPPGPGTGGIPGRTPAEGSAPGQGPWAGPPAGALFVRLLAEVLRWLEAPPDDGSDAPAARPAAWSSCGSVGWQSWWSSQKIRLAAQMAQLEPVAAAAVAGGGVAEVGASSSPSWRTSEPGPPAC